MDHCCGVYPCESTFVVFIDKEELHDRLKGT
jgi:hypothetical protein